MVRQSTNQVTYVPHGIECYLNFHVVGVDQVGYMFQKHLKYSNKIFQFD